MPAILNLQDGGTFTCRASAAVSCRFSVRLQRACRLAIDILNLFLQNKCRLGGFVFFAGMSVKKADENMGDDASKTVVKTLKDSELRYRRLFEAAQDGILILDAETGMIEDVNPYLIKMLGYSREEFIKKKLWEVGAFKDIEASQDAFEALQRNEYIRYEDLPLKDERRAADSGGIRQQRLPGGQRKSDPMQYP